MRNVGLLRGNRGGAHDLHKKTEAAKRRIMTKKKRKKWSPPVSVIKAVAKKSPRSVDKYGLQTCTCTEVPK